jgi:methionyl-tRNA formyltransferase
MMKKEDGRIDWRQSALAIHNLVRGLTPWPGAYTTLQGETLKLGNTLPEDGVDAGADADAGEIVAADAEGVRIACGDGTLLVRALQLPGKKRLSAADFLRGRTLPAGTILGG